MPRICEFYGIAIYMHWRDHPRPHFHARYGNVEARVLIATGESFKGELPVRAARLVRRWSRLHEAELLENWKRCQAGQPLVQIDPHP